MSIVDKRYGATSRVEILNNNTVRKIIDINEFYWAREYFIWKWIASQSAYHPQYSPVIQFITEKKRDCAVITMPYHGRCLSTNSLHTDASFLQIFIDVMRHIRSMHQACVIHRDIKPENIMVQNSRATLIDFGHARLQCCDTQLTNLVYTYLYRPPEIYRGQPYTESADIWAAGVTFASCLLRELLYYVLPTRDRTERGISEYFNSTRDISADIQHALSLAVRTKYRPSTTIFAAWICEMLSVDPNKRPSASALEMRALELANTLHVKILSYEPVKTYYPTGINIQERKEYDAARDEQLKIQVANEVEFVARQLYPEINRDIIEQYCATLIEQRVIQEKNYRTMACAVVVLVGNVVHDQFISIQTVASSCVGVKRAHLAQAIYTLLQTDLYTVLHQTRR